MYTQNMRYRVRGFTLLELIVVIAIIGVLSVIIIPSFKNALARANDTKLKQFAINLEKRYDVTTKYDFDEGGGLLAKDTSINQTSNVPQNDLTIPVSGVSYSQNTYSSSSQYSLLFDGTNYVASKNVNSPQLDGKSFSVSLWFRRTGNFGAVNNFFVSKGPGGGGQQFALGFRYDNLMAGFWGYDWSSPVVVTDTNWHHVVFSFDSSTRLGTFYFDGVRVAEQFTYGVLLSNTNSDTLKVGSISGSPFTGQLDDIRFYESQVIVR
jgi:prepilin-type N-terminal cleavage/methylation domain-containing protein